MLRDPHHTGKLPANKEELRQLRSDTEVGILFRTKGINPWYLVPILPLLCYGIGAVLAYSVGDLSEYVHTPYPLNFSIQLAVALGISIWWDSAVWRTGIEFRTAIAEPAEKYYGFWGTAMMRMYEPLPIGRTPKVHPPTILLFIIISSIFYRFVWLPPQLHETSLHISIQYYLFSLTLIAIAYVVMTIWVISVALYYFTYKIQEMEINIGLSKFDFHDRFQPYNTLIWRPVIAILLNLLIFGVGIQLNPEPSQTVGALFWVILAIVLVAFYVSMQYGLHRAIQKSKRNYVNRLNRSYESDLKHWELSSWYETNTFSKPSIQQYLAIKKEVKSIPDWPDSAIKTISVFVTSGLTAGINLAINLFLI